MSENKSDAHAHANSHTTSSGDSSPKPLVKALGQNEQVADKVEQVAEELLVIHTVLKQELPQQVQTGDVAQALEKHEELENKVQECVQDLSQINQALEAEISERENLERELLQSQLALASEKAKSS